MFDPTDTVFDGVPISHLRDCLCVMSQRKTGKAGEEKVSRIRKTGKAKAPIDSEQPLNPIPGPKVQTCKARIRTGKVVGVRGFEPPTPASRTQYSTRLSYTPRQMVESARRR